MTESPLPPPKKISKNVKIAIVVIPLVFVALIAGIIMGSMANQSSLTNSPTPQPTATPYVYSTLTPTASPIEFSGLSFSPDSILPMVQGSNTKVLITLDNPYSNNEPAVFSADTGSSGIQCTFTNASGIQEWLIINVPTSTPTGTYEATIIATVGQTSHSSQLQIPVLNAQVTVTGTVVFNPTGQPNGVIAPSGIQFIQLLENSTGGTVKGLTYAGTVSGNSATGYSYSITVPNVQWYAFGIVDSSGISYAAENNLNGHDTFAFIQVQAGSTSIIENLSYVNGS
jgi:hypothetical protein